MIADDESMRFALVALGGVLGAVARYLVTLWATERFGPTFPYGTLAVNLTGSVAIGFLYTLLDARAAPGPHWRLFLGVGFLGAYTTFSAYTYDSVQLLAQGQIGPALVNVVGSVLLGLLGVILGIALARLV